MLKNSDKAQQEQLVTTTQCLRSLLGRHEASGWFNASEKESSRDLYIYMIGGWYCPSSGTLVSLSARKSRGHSLWSFCVGWFGLSQNMVARFQIWGFQENMTFLCYHIWSYIVSLLLYLLTEAGIKVFPCSKWRPQTPPLVGRVSSLHGRKSRIWNIVAASHLRVYIVFKLVNVYNIYFPLCICIIYLLECIWIWLFSCALLLNYILLSHL